MCQYCLRTGELFYDFIVPVVCGCEVINKFHSLKSSIRGGKDESPGYKTSYFKLHYLNFIGSVKMKMVSLFLSSAPQSNSA